MNLIPEIVLDFHRLFPSTSVQEDDMDAVDKKKKEVKKDKCLCSYIRQGSAAAGIGRWSC